MRNGKLTVFYFSQCPLSAAIEILTRRLSAEVVCLKPEGWKAAKQSVTPDVIILDGCAPPGQSVSFTGSYQYCQTNYPGALRVTFVHNEELDDVPADLSAIDVSHDETKAQEDAIPLVFFEMRLLVAFLIRRFPPAN